MEESEIQKFFKNSNVFITGGTGFLGKILIEKLLRSTDLSTIYILIRKKKGKNTQARLDELFNDGIFSKLKEEKSKAIEKVIAIEGDCCIAGLGISQTNRDRIISNVNIVFNVAATVKFDENIKLAYNINVEGAKEVIELCKQIKNLRAIVHVSTAFCNCHRKYIEEKFYDDHTLDYDNVGDMLQKMSDEEANMCTERIVGPWPNTYTFTKSLAESLIRDRGRGLPIGIFRPAIVISTYKEPVAGWTDNVYGPNGICAGSGAGLLRVMLADPDKLADTVPVDTCVAGLIAVAWEVGSSHYERITEEIRIYNYVSSVENPLTWQDFLQINKKYALTYPLSDAIWIPKFQITTSHYEYYFLKILYHIAPSLLLDAVGFILGKKQSVYMTYKRIHKLSEVLVYFSMQQWSFRNDNVVKLWDRMSKADQKLFPLSMTTVHWLVYFRNYYLGIRRYVLNDPLETLELARRKQRLFGMFHGCLLACFYAFIIVLGYAIMKKIFGFELC